MLDMNACTLSEGGRVARLCPAGAQLLGMIAASYPAMADRGFLLAQQWGDSQAENPDSNLKVQIFHIRKAVQSAGMDPLVTTAWGRGYVLTRPVAVVQRPMIIPAHLSSPLLSLLWSHHDTAAADRVLARIGVAA